MVALIGACLTLRASAPARALEVPPRPLGRVSDFAGALPAEARNRLEAQLAGYEPGSTRQIAIAVFRSLDGESLEDFSIRLAERWKIGGKAKSDGVLLLVFLEDRQLRIEVGYGLEGELTDAQSARIIREVMVPSLRAGDLEAALRGGAAAVDTAISGRAHAEGQAPPTAPRRGGPLPDWVLFLVLFTVLAALRIFGGRGRRGGWIATGGGWSSGSRRGGGWSGGGGGWSGGGGSFGGGGASGRW